MPQSSQTFENYEILYLLGFKKAKIGMYDKIGRFDESSKNCNINTDIFFGS